MDKADSIDHENCFWCLQGLIAVMTMRRSTVAYKPGDTLAATAKIEHALRTQTLGRYSVERAFDRMLASTPQEAEPP